MPVVHRGISVPAVNERISDTPYTYVVDCLPVQRYVE